MRKNVAKSITSLVAVTACFLSLITASVAWFEPNTDVRLDSGSGSTAASYFASGDGSEKTPYEITLPIHLYNLAWLQYLGQFNTKEAPIYFKLGDDIDMSSFGSALPPIGTESEPFIGVFDGGGYTISNLTVSDNITDNGGDISIKPNTVTSVTGCSVVGFFGIVGDPTNLGFSKDSDLVYSKSSISNFYLENVAVESTTTNTLIGVVAGYVGSGGSVSDIGVKNGSIEVANGATGLNDSYKETISKFSLIGDTEDTNWTTAYASGGGSGDGGNDWGGSINIYELSKRITYIMNDSMSYSSYSSIASPNKFGLANISYNKYNSTTQSFYELSGLQAYIYNGSNFPLNVDTDTEFDGGEITSTKTDSSSKYRNWKTATTNFFNGIAKDKEGNSYSSEILKDNNPGYITSPVDTSNNAKQTGTLHYIRATSTVQNSFGGTSYDPDKLVMLTYDSSSNSLVRIVDGNNTTNNSSLNSIFSGSVKSSTLHKYNEVKNYFSDVYTNGSASLIYTLGWTNKTSSTLSGTFTMDQKSYTSVLSPGIDFVVHSKGYIAVVFCSQSNDNGNNLVSLYKVTRSDDGTPSKGDEITTGIPSVTDSNFATNKCILYLEIPVEAGEYFITTDTGSASTAADFMYLDIGASDNDSGDSTSTTYTLNNVRYVHEIPLNTSTTSYADILFVISTAAAAGDSKIYFKRDSATHLYYYVGGGTNITVTMLKLKDASSENNASAIWPSSSSDSSSSTS